MPASVVSFRVAKLGYKSYKTVFVQVVLYTGILAIQGDRCLPVRKSVVVWIFPLRGIDVGPIRSAAEEKIS